MKFLGGFISLLFPISVLLNVYINIHKVFTAKFEQN